MEDNLINDINYLYKKKQWHDIIDYHVDSNDKEVARAILWAWPSLNTLDFIGNITRKYNKTGIISVGCGSGLFEWLLTQATNIPVTGLELENSWWNSKHSLNKYITHKFVTMPLENECLPNDQALFFCYFNSTSAFQEYIQVYQGDLVFIVGPGPTQDRYTNPQPLNPDFGDAKWKLLDQHEIKNTGDYVAAWICEK